MGNYLNTFGWTESVKILSIVGTRPNFMKIAPLAKEFRKRRIRHVLVHTGQHYDREMSQLFFDQLLLPKPDINLGIGSGTVVEQVGRILIALEKVLRDEKPDIVVVVGDVNSTFAGAFAAKQLGIPVAHVEAGLRSFDWSMPEEINRVLTDRISDHLFTTEESANRNLLNEGRSGKNIHFVGNVMIDTLLAHRREAASSTILQRLHLSGKGYGVLTLHRPSNVDTKKSLASVISIIEELQKVIPIVFPIHPRTRRSIQSFGLGPVVGKMKNLTLTPPLGYLDFLCLMDNARIVLTDSGGIQEETTALGVPCITLRNNTERPVTVNQGTNLLVSTSKSKVVETALQAIERKTTSKKKIPQLWDGKAARRIVQVLKCTLK